MPDEVEKLRAQVCDLLIRLVDLQQYPRRMADMETMLRRMIAERDAEIVQLRQRLGLVKDARPVAPGDDLREIRGIGPGIERILNGLGVCWFRQIALWADEEVAFYGSNLGHFRDRIERDGWIERARALHLQKYGEKL